jgi:hypothetical protein
MAVQPITMWQAVCDGCGMVHSGEEYVAWTDPESAIDVALNGDWCQHTEPDGTTKLYCEDCRATMLAQEDEGGLG